jgi:NitT/TauT family transport system permease protein
MGLAETRKRPPVGAASGLRAAGEFIRRHHYPFVTIAVILVLWQIIGGSLNPIFLSTPQRVAGAFVQLMASGELLRNFWQTLSTFSLGVLLAMVVGVPCGLLAGRYRAVGNYTEAAIRIFYALPVIALFPLFIVWFGVANEFRLAIVFLAGVFPVWINAQAGVKSIDATLIEVARVFGAREREILTKIIAPATIPFVAAGFKLAIGRAMVTTIAVELLTSTKGLGGMMGFYGNSFKTAEYFAPLILVALFSLLAFEVGERVERHYSRWRPSA